MSCKFFETGRASAGSVGEEEPNIVSKPPKSTPHSDIDGVHRDEKPNVEAAVESGQDNEDLARAAKENVARPDYLDDVKNKDDRST